MSHDGEPCDATALLEDIPGAYERAREGLERGLAGESVGLDDLSGGSA